MVKHHVLQQMHLLTSVH